jgi:hypothetical protein
LDKAGRFDSVARQDVIYLGDVDYWIDGLPGFLADNFRPMMLLTNYPTVAGDSMHAFASDAKYTTIVGGSKGYSHYLWDWSPDCIIVHSDRTVFGVPSYVTVYMVEKRHLDTHKCLVMLTPIVRWPSIFGLFASVIYSGDTLKRFNPIVGKDIVKVHRHNGDGEHVVSITTVGFYSAVECRVADFDACVRAWNNSDPKIFSATNACSWFGSYGPERDRQLGHQVLHYCRTFDNRPPVQVPAYAPPPINRVSANTKASGDCTESPAVRAFMPPVLPDAMTWTTHDANSILTIQSRVLTLQMKAAATPALDLATTDRLRQFVEVVRKGRAPFSPHEYDEVVKNQARPSQVMILARAAASGNAPDDDKLRAESFQKKEVYYNFKEPRPITTPDAVPKATYSGMCMAMTEYMKAHNFYAFKKPKQIAAQLVRGSADALFAVVFDISRMDGSTSYVVRDHVHKPIYRAAFADRLDDVESYFRAMTNRTAVMDRKWKYHTGTSVLSGEPGTSVNNTMTSAAITYIAILHLTGDDDAYAKLVLGNSCFGGDDAIVFINRNFSYAQVDAAYKYAAESLGYSVTMDYVKRGKPYSFLGRYFNTWYGDLDSCADVYRQLAKLHTTVGIVDPVTKAIEKATSYLLTDANTPLLGEWALAVILKYAKLGVDYKSDPDRWWSQYDRNDQFPNAHQEWMDDIADAVGLNIVLFRECARADPMRMKVCAGPRPLPRPKYDMDLNGELHRGESGAAPDKNVKGIFERKNKPDPASAPDQGAPRRGGGRGSGGPRDNEEPRAKAKQPRRGAKESQDKADPSNTHRPTAAEPK